MNELLAPLTRHHIKAEGTGPTRTDQEVINKASQKPAATSAELVQGYSWCFSHNYSSCLRGELEGMVHGRQFLLPLHRRLRQTIKPRGKNFPKFGVIGRSGGSWGPSRGFSHSFVFLSKRWASGDGSWHTSFTINPSTVETNNITRTQELPELWYYWKKRRMLGTF